MDISGKSGMLAGNSWSTFGGEVVVRRGVWVQTPTSGGRSVPKPLRRRIEERINRHAKRRFKGKYTHLAIRFRGKFCYIDAYTEPEVPKRLPRDFPETKQELVERLRNTPTHLCRLRCFSEDRWSFAVHTYSNEKYEDAVFPSGDFWGTPEEAFEVAAGLYLS
jgi:hypothetical protein